jgi:tetratricopeptide (TPR) repeat protein
MRGVFRIVTLPAIAAAVAIAGASTQPAVSFAMGQQALQRGDLIAAEKAFRDVLVASPGNAGAHANLGVIYMRRQQWRPALDELQRARTLDPATPGIRLNIGLVYFRQSDYSSAIAPLESVVKDQPDLAQARYLLGFCYFLVDRYRECVGALERLWPSSNGDLNYLYVLMIAAGKAGHHDLADKASNTLLHTGEDSAELRLFWGMALLARDEDAKALEQFQEAAQRDPQLRFLHYYLGLTYKRQHQLAQAKQEFLKDCKLEPDVAYNYDELGAVSLALQEFDPARKYFQEALKLDPALATSWFGLAKVYRREKHYADALTALTNAERIAPDSPSVQYLKGQTLMALGKPAEARKALDGARQLEKRVEDKLQEAISGTKYRDLQVMHEK